MLQTYSIKENLRDYNPAVNYFIFGGDRLQKLEIILYGQAEDYLLAIFLSGHGFCQV